MYTLKKWEEEMKKLLFAAMLISLTVVLAGCNGNSSDFDHIEFNFDKEIVKEYLSNNESSVEDYTLSTNMRTLSNIDYFGESFYRIHDNNEYVYYTMSSIEIFRQSDDVSSGFGHFTIDYRYPGVIGIRDGSLMHLYLEDGSYLGEHPEGYYLDTWDNDYYINDVLYMVYYVEYQWDVQYVVVENTSTGQFFVEDIENFYEFDVFEFIHSIAGEDQDDASLITKQRLPFFEEDSEYYYSMSNMQIMIYDGNDQLVNSFSTMEFQNSVLIGTTLFTHRSERVEPEVEDYTYSVHGYRYKATTTSYDIITDEYKVLDLDYVPYFGYGNLYASNNPSDYAAIGILEIGPDRMVINEEPRPVLINESCKVVSDLIGFSYNTIYDTDGYFFDPYSSSLFKDDLTLISNNVSYYSPEHNLFVVETNGEAQVYDMSSNTLLDEGYDVVNYGVNSLTLEKDDENYIFTYADLELTALSTFGNILYQNDYIIITFDTESNVINVYNTLDMEVQATTTLTGLHTYANVLQVIEPDSYYEFYNVDRYQGHIFLETNAGTIKIDYTVQY